MVRRDLGLLDGEPIAEEPSPLACAPRCFRKDVVDQELVRGAVNWLRILSKITQDVE